MGEVRGCAWAATHQPYAYSFSRKFFASTMFFPDNRGQKKNIFWMDLVCLWPVYIFRRKHTCCPRMHSARVLPHRVNTCPQERRPAAMACIAVTLHHLPTLADHVAWL
jgi:hypothetical protein